MKNTTKSIRTLLLATSALVAIISPANAALDEMFVTAERREAGIQDVPLSITAFGEADFERLQAASLEDLHLKAPNITIVRNTTTSNSAQVFIRGIGRDDSTWNVESGVAIYVDGAYLPQQSGALLDLIEFERVEVLRGPQGTLYGRSATGGSIQFVTKRPDLDEPTFKGDLTLGSFDRVDVRGSVSVPLVEGELAAKLDFISRDNKGFVNDVDSSETFNGTNRQTGRLSLLWNPSPTWDVYLAADVQRDRSGIQTLTPTRLDTGGFGTPNNPDANGVADPAFGSNFVANPGINNVNDYDGYGALARVDWYLDWGTVTSTTSYRGFQFDLEGDLDGQSLITLDFGQSLESRTFQQEIQLASSLEGPVEFVVGGFYISDTIEADANNIFNGFQSFSEQDTTSFAVYGELTYNITDWLGITGGARYSKDDKDIEQAGFSLAEGPSGPSAFDVNVSDDFDAVTPKAVIEVRPLEAGLGTSLFDDLLFYAQYQEGYKTGGVANGRPTSAESASTIFDREDSRNLEFGFKADMLDSRLRVNAAYFFLEQENLAATVLDPITNQISVVTADAEMDGLEVEVIANPLEGLTLFGTAATLNDEIVKSEPGSPFVVGVSELKHKPDWHYVFGGTYERQLSNMGTIGAGVTYTKSASIFRNVGNTLNVRTPETEIVDARIFFEAADEKWGVELAGKNLSDEEYWSTGISTFGRYYAPEATWSLTFKAKL